MDHLANELLCDIFKQLNVDNVNKCMNVCKQWKNIIYGNIEYLVEHYSFLQQIQKKIVNLTELQNIIQDQMYKMCTSDYYIMCDCCNKTYLNDDEPYPHPNRKREYACLKHNIVYCRNHYFICEQCDKCACGYFLEGIYSGKEIQGMFPKCQICQHMFCIRCNKQHICGEQKYKFKTELKDFIVCGTCNRIGINSSEWQKCDLCSYSGMCKKCIPEIKLGRNKCICGVVYCESCLTFDVHESCSSYC